jgi:hypothetical protein
MSAAASAHEPPTWDGITLSSTLKSPYAEQRVELADRAKAYDWERVFAILDENREWVNSPRLDGGSLYSPLHQAAHGGAPTEVIERLLSWGAWRTLRTAKGERAVDIAKRQGHSQLVPMLEPVLLRTYPAAPLAAVQGHFHRLVLRTAGELVRKHCLRLPELEILTELEKPEVWLPIPQMYGGFRFWLHEISSSPSLLADSWSRMVEGSTERHIITAHGTLLVSTW